MRAVRSIALAGAAIAVLALGAGGAAADPASVPPPQSIVVVGADTAAALFDQFAVDYDATSPAYPLYDFDPTSVSTIDTKNNAACDNLVRPTGTTDGIEAVSTSPTFTVGGTTYQCEDLASASRALMNTDPTNMAQDIIAEDLVSYSYQPGGHIPSNLTTTELKAIFSCNAALINSSFSGPVTENEIGGVGSDVVLPVIPQSTSGTRVSWLVDDLGLSNTSIASCVVNGSYTNPGGTAFPILENEGTNPVFDAAEPDPAYPASTSADEIFPYAGGDYVCYNDTKACQAAQFKGEFNSGSLVLGDINGTLPLTGTAPNQTINASGFSSAFLRGLYVDFVASTTNSNHIPTYLQPLLGTGVRGSGWICTRTAPAVGQGDITKFGFVNTSTCGTITVN